MLQIVLKNDKFAYISGLITTDLYGKFFSQYEHIGRQLLFLAFLRYIGNQKCKAQL